MEKKKLLAWAIGMFTILIIVLSTGGFLLNVYHDKVERLDDKEKICQELGYEEYSDWYGMCYKKSYFDDGYNYYTKFSGLIDFEKYKRENWK